MVEVEIRGKKFPLCLTVAALDKINEKCGGLKHLSAWLNGSDDITIVAANTAWLLGVLVTEGEENRLMEARFSGDRVDRKAVPDSEALSHLLTPGSAIKYRVPVMEAVNESLRQDIEAEHSKNVAHAERR